MATDTQPSFPQGQFDHQNTACKIGKKICTHLCNTKIFDTKIFSGWRAVVLGALEWGLWVKRCVAIVMTSRGSCYVIATATRVWRHPSELKSRVSHTE